MFLYLQLFRVHECFFFNSIETKNNALYLLKVCYLKRCERDCIDNTWPPCYLWVGNTVGMRFYVQISYLLSLYRLP